MHYKQNNKQTKTYVQGLRAFGSTLPRGVKGILKKNGYNYSEIISKWNMLVGQDVSGCAYPKSIKMKNGNSNGTLILAVKRGDEINIEYGKKDIINKINSYFGYKLINEIRLETFGFKMKKNDNKNSFINLSKSFNDKINKIENKSIRDSLFKLFEKTKK